MKTVNNQDYIHLRYLYLKFHQINFWETRMIHNINKILGDYKPTLHMNVEMPDQRT